MIASDDVRRVTFDRAMRGYRCEDVDDYLKQVADSIDSLAAENDDLQKKLVILAQRIDQYRADEDTLSTTMINAQRLGENVIKPSRKLPRSFVPPTLRRRIVNSAPAMRWSWPSRSL